MTSIQFECKCGKNGGWIADGQELPPCRVCGRKYKGVYDVNELTIKVVEIK